MGHDEAAAPSDGGRGEARPRRRSWRERLRVPDSVRGIVAVLRLLPRVDRRTSVVFAVIVVLQAGLPVAAAIVTGQLVGSIPSTVRGGFGSAAGRTTITLLVTVAAMILVQRMTAPYLRAAATVLGRHVDRYLQEVVIASVGRPVGIAHLEDPAVLDRLRLARGLGIDTNRPSLAIEGLSLVLPSWLQALGSAAVLFWFAWWLGLAWVVVWPLLVYAMQNEYVRVGQLGYGQSTALRRSEYLRDLALGAPAAKELRIWGMLGWLIERFESTWLAAIEPVWRARRLRLRVVLGSSGTIAAINLLSYGVLAWAAIRGDLGLGALAVFTQALAGANSFTAFDDSNAYLSYAAVSVPKLLALREDLEPESPSPQGKSVPQGSSALRRSSALGGGVPATFPEREIHFAHVRFRYPRAERDALRDLELRLPVGHSLAIVGENGAGKTSLVKLLCGLYAPSAGRITLDGTDLQALDAYAWRGRIAALFQDFARYQLSAADNIALGAPAYAGDTARLRSAAERAGALDLIEGLPRGWDTVLSREYEAGTDLSGGQWQRIALARAMFAVEAGARVLILDEPTAALDVRAEAELYDRFLDLTAGLTTFLVSHRFSTVRRADRIVVVADGGIVEDGTHEELMATGGRYAEMFTLQAARFTAEDTEAAVGNAVDTTNSLEVDRA